MKKLLLAAGMASLIALGLLSGGRAQNGGYNQNGSSSGGVAVIPPAPGNFYVYLSTGPTCAVSSPTGSEVCALNQQTQTVVSKGSDAAVVEQNINETSHLGFDVIQQSRYIGAVA